MSCATYVTPFEAQLPQRYGSVGCTATSAGRAGVHATCGTRNIQGAQIRALTDEPIPDPRSPGLNLPQVAEALGDLGISLDVRIGSRQDIGSVGRSVTWELYEEYRMRGIGCILQVSYGPIADSPMDAGNGFRGGHAIFETLHGTYESLADGRRPGVWKYDGRVYDRPMIRRAASLLPIPLSNGTITRPMPGTVWAAFTRDVVPLYVAEVRPLPGQKRRKLAVYTVVDGRITQNSAQTTGGILAGCSPPQYVRAPGGGYKFLCRLESNAPGRIGKWIYGGFARIK